MVLMRIRQWLARPAVEREEDERYMSQSDRDKVDEGMEGLAADARAEERFGPLPHERDDD